ncbi:glycerophosphodiester phosphodiesterase family protein [Halovulum sp. GXIMD14794]
MTGPINELWRARRQILALHIGMTLLAVAVIGPLSQLVLRLAIRLSGSPALTDQDIARFLLSPVGFAGLLVAGAVALTAAVLETAVILWALRLREQGQPAPLKHILPAVLKRLPSLILLAGHLLLRLLAILLPGAILLLLIARWQLGDYDINYYLSNRPPEFLLAVGLAAPVVLVTALVLLKQASGWIYTLPLVLFGAKLPRQAFAESARLSDGQRRRIVLRLVLWAAIATALAFAVSLIFRGAVWLALPPLDASLRLIAAATVVLLLIWGALITVAGAAAAGLLAAVIYDLSRQLPFPPLPEPSPVSPRFARMATIGVLLLLGASTIATAAGLLGRAGTPDEVEIIAHRGAAGARPENTLAAMEKAIEDGADWLELDVQEDAEGRVIVVHDSDFMKIAGVDLKVWDATEADLAEIDIGSWFDGAYAEERTPTLAQVLEMAKDRANVLVELKYYGHDERLAERVAEVVEQTGMVDQTAFMSLKPEQVAAMQRVRQDWRTGLLAATALGDLARYDADFLAVNTATASAGFIDRARKAGRDVYVWTVNDPLTMSRMISRGAAGLITDEPAMAGQVIEARADMTLAERFMLELADLVGIESQSGSYRDESP